MTKRKKKGGKFMALPQVVFDSPEFVGLSAKALKLLIDIYAQYNGSNNGDLTASMGHMKHRGWNSNRALSAALQELQDARMVIRTREGRFNPRMCALYAVTWKAIDECRGKHLDVEPTQKAPVQFSIPKNSNVVRLRN